MFEPFVLPQMLYRKIGFYAWPEFLQRILDWLNLLHIKLSGFVTEAGPHRPVFRWPDAVDCPEFFFVRKTAAVLVIFLNPVEASGYRPLLCEDQDVPFVVLEILIVVIRITVVPVQSYDERQSQFQHIKTKEIKFQLDYSYPSD